MGITDNLQYTSSEVVIHALADLKKPKGLSFKEILSYALVKHKVHQNSFKVSLEHALKRGLKYRILDFHNGRYSLSHRLRQFLKKNKQAITRTRKKTPKNGPKKLGYDKREYLRRYLGKSRKTKKSLGTGTRRKKKKKTAKSKTERSKNSSSNRHPLRSKPGPRSEVFYLLVAVTLPPNAVELLFSPNGVWVVCGNGSMSVVSLNCV